VTSSRGWGLLVACVLGALLAGSLVVLAGAPVSAQDDPNETDNESDVAGVVAQLDDDLRVVEYEYSDERERMTIEIEHVGESDRRAQVTATELVAEREGDSGTFGVDSARIAPDETIELRLSVERVNGVAGVLLISDESIEEGTGVFVRDGEEPTSIFEGAPTWQDVRVGAGVGILATVLGFLLVSWQVVSKQETGYQEVEL